MKKKEIIFHLNEEKIKTFLEKKKTVNLNQQLKNSKEFSNPEILKQIIKHFDINQYGTNFETNQTLKEQ